MHHRKKRKVAVCTPHASIFDSIWRHKYIVFAVLALLVAGRGVATLTKGSIVYYNYRGLVVYAPYTIVVGLGLLLWSLFLWRKSR